MNTIEALQNLYVSMGGTLSDVETLNTIPEMINAISGLEPGGEEERTITSDEINTIIDSIS